MILRRSALPPLAPVPDCMYAVNLSLDTVIIRPVQIRMARAALGWGVRDLANKTGLTANTISRIENGADARGSSLESIRQVFIAEGIVFLDDNGGGPGLRLRSLTKPAK